MGAVVYNYKEGVEEKIHLGNFATVFQAEVMAINRCAEKLIENGTMGTNIAICTDSKASIKALKKVEVRICK